MPSQRNDSDELYDWDAPAEQSPQPEPETYGISAPESLPEPPARVLPEMGPSAENRPATVQPRKRRRRIPDERPRKKKSRRTPLDDTPVPTLASSVWYPLTGSGWWVIPGMALVLGVTRAALSSTIPLPAIFVGVVMIVGVLTLLSIAQLFLETANYTIASIPAGPRFPLCVCDAPTAGMYGLTTVMTALIPMSLAVGVFNRLGVDNGVPQLVLTACGMYYIPMGFLALAELENEHALNPLVVVRGMFRMGFRYFLLVTLAATLYLLPAIGLMLLRLSPFITWPLNALLLLYTTTALMRAAAISFVNKRVSFDPSLK